MIQTGTAISVNSIEKSYKNLKVLTKIDYTVPKGSIFALWASGYDSLKESPTDGLSFLI